MFCMYMLNSEGESTEPCDTPLVYYLVVEDLPMYCDALTARDNWQVHFLHCYACVCVEYLCLGTVSNPSLCLLLLMVFCMQGLLRSTLRALCGL